MAIKVEEVKFYDNDRIYATVKIKTYEDGRVEIVPPDGYRMYPMDIETADISAHGYASELIRMWWKGSRQYKCYMVPVSEKLFKVMMRPDWSEDKRNLRSHKCRVEGAHGTPIICRKASCVGCPNAGKDMETNQTSYIEDLKKNSNWEPATEDTTSSEAMGHVLYDELICFLAKHQKKLAKIKLLEDEGYSVKEIHEILDLSINTIYTDRKRLKKLENEFFKED